VGLSGDSVKLTQWMNPGVGESAQNSGRISCLGDSARWSAALSRRYFSVISRFIRFVDRLTAAIARSLRAQLAGQRVAPDRSNRGGDPESEFAQTRPRFSLEI
jgi:hypothetical protein